jgi:3-phenylpropionate/trans-cinnamate dioxygenase ferredoxin subunit
MANNNEYRTRRYVVAKVKDVPEGGHVICDLGGRQIGVFRLDGEFHAILHRCPHLGGPLCEGTIIGLVESEGPGDVRLNNGRKMLTCPWHGWEFDIKTGQSYFDPIRMRARQYPVSVEDGRTVLHALESGQEEPVPGPYRAEVYPVAVEDEYVVVTLREAVATFDEMPQVIAANAMSGGELQ